MSSGLTAGVHLEITTPSAVPVTCRVAVEIRCVHFVLSLARSGLRPSGQRASCGGWRLSSQIWWAAATRWVPALLCQSGGGRRTAAAGKRRGQHKASLFACSLLLVYSCCGDFGYFHESNEFES
ncbi:hypothetical protein SORBI_3004G174301 [Sorghum bicolor]|uniref:Uncharacterized protein n=1 Tax=Sorghum bicolor TaxID=4558 RepID=A0A1Z5RNC9_SORBI|nr:hypothetical protein SORBI_3004G174301 [Sorghum bicolor]